MCEIIAIRGRPKTRVDKHPRNCYNAKTRTVHFDTVMLVSGIMDIHIA